MVAANTSNMSSFSSLSQVSNLFAKFHLCVVQAGQCTGLTQRFKFTFSLDTVKKQQQEHSGENAGNPPPR